MSSIKYEIKRIFLILIFFYFLSDVLNINIMTLPSHLVNDLTYIKDHLFEMYVPLTT